MSNPTIFISCVSKELGSARQQVANSLIAMGYNPIWQDVFDTSPGELLEVIRGKMRGCDGIIQIVGRSYGSEPPEETEQFGRVSYTQYELLYAESLGIKVWVVPIAGAMQKDGDTDLRQLDYLQKLETKNFLRHEVNDENELEITILKMRDDFSELRLKSEKNQKKMFSQLRLILFVLLVIGGLVLVTKNALKENSEANRSTIEKLEESVAKTVDNQMLERQLLSRVLEYTSKSLDEEKGLSFEDSYAQAVVTVAEEEELPIVKLESKIETYIAVVKSEGSKADPIDRVLVAEKEQRVGQAKEVAETTLKELELRLPAIVDEKEKFRINTVRILLIAAIFRATQEEERHERAEAEVLERERLEREEKLAEERKQEEEKKAIAEKEALKPKPKTAKEWVLDAKEHERVIHAKINVLFRTKYIEPMKRGGNNSQKLNAELREQVKNANSVVWSEEQLKDIYKVIDPMGKVITKSFANMRAGKFNSNTQAKLNNLAKEGKIKEKELIEKKIILGTLKRKLPKK